MEAGMVMHTSVKDLLDMKILMFGKIYEAAACVLEKRARAVKRK